MEVSLASVIPPRFWTLETLWIRTQIVVPPFCLKLLSRGDGNHRIRLTSTDDGVRKDNRRWPGELSPHSDLRVGRAAAGTLVWLKSRDLQRLIQWQCQTHYDRQAQVHGSALTRETHTTSVCQKSQAGPQHPLSSTLLSQLTPWFCVGVIARTAHMRRTSWTDERTFREPENPQIVACKHARVQNIYTHYGGH